MHKLVGNEKYHITTVAPLSTWWRSMWCLFLLVLCLIRIFVSSYPPVGFMGFIIFLQWTSISWLSFTVLLFSSWYVHHVRSHSLGTDSMAKIVKEGVHFYTFRALYKLAELCQLEMGDSGGEVPRDWKSLGSELWCQFSCARQALSHLDRVIKMSVKDVILYLTLCCPAWLL